MFCGCGGSRNDPGMTHPADPPPTDSISGTVTYKGAPLPGATITLWITNTNSVAATTSTDANGDYSFSGIQTTGNVPGEYHLWASKNGYGFYPSAGTGAKVIRADHTGEFEPTVTATSTFGVPIYLTVIDFVATANNSVTNANFAAFDGSNPVVRLAATGQTQSYAPGDDGDLKEGLAWAVPRYTDNANGTITDNLTGLIWLKNAGCFATTTWNNALTDVNGLASGMCGLSDGSTAGQWRIPNLVELDSLIDPSASGPALTAAHPFVNVANSIYWTSTTYFGGEEGSPNAWAIRLQDGRYVNDGTLNSKASANNSVWAVRGSGSGQARLQATGLFDAFGPGDDGSLQIGAGLMYPRFIHHGDGTVTDLMTGLVWLQLADCIQGDWTTAIAQANTLASGQCGLTDNSVAGDWHMPNRNEMQSLADRNQNNESDYLNFTFLNPDLSVFQPAVLSGFQPYHYYWTSTTDAADPTEAWTVFSCDFGVYDTDKSATGFALAVRQPR